MKRLAIFALVLTATQSFPVAWAQPDPASAEVFRSKVRLARAYFRQLQGLPVDARVLGPDFGRVFKDAEGSQQGTQLSVDQISSRLSACRGAGFQVGGSPQIPGKTVGTMSFECYGKENFFPVLEAIVAIGDDAKKIEELQVRPISEMRWTSNPPPPSEAEIGYGNAKFAGYETQSRGVVAAIKGPQNAFKAGKFKAVQFYEWDDDYRKDVLVSSARMAQMLAPCRIRAVGETSKSTFDQRPERHSTRMLLKCDARSSSDSDVIAFATFSNGKIDGLGLMAYDGYRLPPAGAAN